VVVVREDRKITNGELGGRRLREFNLLCLVNGTGG